jgi:ABC-type transport system involved in multi-copper enzyme maturation permease subunit
MLAAISGLTAAVGWQSGRYGGIRDPGETGMTLAWATLWCQAGLLLILAPLASASRISQEREQRTLPALINSPLSAGRIARGKLWGAWTFTLWLGILALPFLVVAGLWGGVSASTLWVGLMLNLLMGLTLSTMAMGLSGLFGRSLTAYLATGAMLFFWTAAWPMIGGMVTAFTCMHNGGESGTALGYLFWFHSPFYPIIALMMRESGEPMPDGWMPILYAVGVWVLLAMGGYRLAVRGLRREVY